MGLSNERIEEAMRQLEEINADEELKKALYYRERYKYEMNTAIYEAVKEKDEELKNTQKELQSTKDILSKKDEELKSTKDALSILIKTLQETGKSIEEISLITNMDILDIKNILKNSD